MESDDSDGGGGLSTPPITITDWNEKRRMISNEVRITSMENPPNGMDGNSLIHVTQFLIKVEQSIGADLYERHKPHPKFVSWGAIAMLTYIRAYRIAGKAVPRAWIDICQTLLQPIIQKRILGPAARSISYELLYTQRERIAISTQKILQTFVDDEILWKYGTSNAAIEASANATDEASGDMTSEASANKTGEALGSRKRRRSCSPA